MQISKLERKNDKMFLVFYIIAFELVLANLKYYKENTCHPQSVF